ncbi:adenylyl-sulfate kinase [Algoriphagus sp. AK58]|uniref:adenylyl-sulfate kinase n=1 Tax=Algoriphagus sp. AK58 TaxID=1406877 RepID=UPI001650305D|nr:adenylyl-sulfate kinase [Algoriphagus sp. AK58]MBC6366474.1 adenylyl-sulfate kinase [Algoriphagus sp. AK58]
MVFIQLTGLSGAGKSTIAYGVKSLLENNNHRVEVIDADIYRKILCPDLGFSKEDRKENIRRLGFVANLLATHGVIAILAAINPYEDTRRILRSYGSHVYTVWVKCEIQTLISRDTKDLYKRALLPENHPEKIHNLTGINDPFELPENPDLILSTHLESVEKSVEKLFSFISTRIQDKQTSAL